MAEAAKEEAVKLAKQLSELQLVEVCAGLSLTPKDGKTDRKKALKNCLVRYLESEELEEKPDEDNFKSKSTNFFSLFFSIFSSFWKKAIYF